MNKQLVALNEIGQSVWYDNLSKDVLESGELKSLIDAGVLGLTSNPTIFKKAIADTNDYDSDLSDLVSKGMDVHQIAEELMLRDVAKASDLLMPLYENTSKKDGYASIEVSPTLAHDTEGTVSAGKRIWDKLNRPNIMIKVPATDAGIPAIEQLLTAGINVNVTLIFSSDVYKEVIKAYKNAVKARVSKGEDVSSLASVASFFVSRVDAIVEKEFAKLKEEGKVEEGDLEKILGKIGIANSKEAYNLFKDEFNGENFPEANSNSAQVQRPLWASTGTKNTSFSKVLYVEQLAGPDTVNTIPPATLTAVMESANIENKVDSKIEEARGDLENLKALGINLSELLVVLQKDGVSSFADSYTELIEALEKKISQL